MVQVPIREDLRSQPGYVPFVDALQALFDLHRLPAADISWVVTRPQFDSTFPPSSIISIAKDTPQLAVAIKPNVGGSPIYGIGTYHAPMILRDVQRWGLVSNTLAKYIVTGLSGVPEENELFSESRTLADIIQHPELKLDKVTNTTAVVEAAALLPIAQNGEFATEFVPSLRFDGHSYYKVAVISQDRLSAYSLLSQGRKTVAVKNIGVNQEMFNWTADYVPGLSALEKLLLPSQTGHMIIIATPVQAPFQYNMKLPDKLPEEIRFPPGMYGSGHSFEDSQMRTFGVGSGTRGVSIGDVRIGRGSAAGQGSLYTGTMQSSEQGNPVIYHLRVLGVKPEQARSITADQLRVMGQSVSNNAQQA